VAHLILQYSCELEKKYDFQDLANNLRKVMVETTLFPVGGIRVRALPTQINSIADGDSLNVYVDLVLRMGSGRTLSDKQKIGKDLMKFLEFYFKNEIKEEYFALSLEIIDINPSLSWKLNTIHSRLKK
tara:strand:- start:912 stop:1295 length:384 start_codon:yes stop_codon:yes gene_type:complete